MFAFWLYELPLSDFWLTTIIVLVAVYFGMGCLFYVPWRHYKQVEKLIYISVFPVHWLISVLGPHFDIGSKDYILWKGLGIFQDKED